MDVNRWLRVVEASCTIATLRRSYVTCTAGSEHIHPVRGMALCSDGAVLSCVRYVFWLGQSKWGKG